MYLANNINKSVSLKDWNLNVFYLNSLWLMATINSVVQLYIIKRWVSPQYNTVVRGMCVCVFFLPFC